MSQPLKIGLPGGLPTVLQMTSAAVPWQGWDVIPIAQQQEAKQLLAQAEAVKPVVMTGSVYRALCPKLAGSRSRPSQPNTADVAGQPAGRNPAVVAVGIGAAPSSSGGDQKREGGCCIRNLPSGIS